MITDVILSNAESIMKACGNEKVVEYLGVTRSCATSLEKFNFK